MAFDDAIGTFLIAIACGVVMGIAVLMLIYKMVDGDLPVGAGLVALILIVFSMALAIHPPHPVLPGVILVITLALMAFFPYAERVLEDHALREVDANRLARTFEAVRVRPDNFAAKFELAQLLHRHGFQAQAMQLAGSTLASLSTEQDQLRNRSMRDVFYREEALLKRWQQGPQNAHSVKCPGCGATNQPTDLFCRSCGRPYMLEIVQGQGIKPRVWGKLVLAWAVLALFIPLNVAIAMNLEGVVRIAAFVAGLGGVAALLTFLFRPPAHAPVIEHF